MLEYLEQKRAVEAIPVAAQSANLVVILLQLLEAIRELEVVPVLFLNDLNRRQLTDKRHLFFDFLLELVLVVFI